MSEQALSGIRVLDLADAKGVYGTRILSDLGADVIKVEPPDGDPMRKIPPFVGDVPGTEKSLHWLYRNLNKRGITLDLESREGREIFKRLVKSSDILVETFEPGYMKQLGLDFESLREVNTGLIMASITDFGQTGPHSHYKGSDIVDFAMSGAMIVNGTPDRAPVNMPGTVARDCGAICAMGGVLIALYARSFNGEGQHVDVSVQEAALTGLYAWSIPGYSYRSAGGRLPFAGPRMMPRTGALLIAPCKDGYVHWLATSPRQFDGLYALLGNPPELVEMGNTLLEVAPRIGEQIDKVTNHTMKMTMQEFFERGQEQFGLPCCPVCTPSEFIDNPHIKARGFFQDVEHPEVGKGSYATIPFKMTETPARVVRWAPRLGEHNEEIYHGELGLTMEELSALRRAGII
ncbi:MAG: CoA transferase [Dehalococcoidia bacterium]|nr:MAG: CoA transferase [Dehalococcoidia bacterium]UCG82568.1 MAG: CoA transferase [Dehalococcoidia bacterium]